MISHYLNIGLNFHQKGDLKKAKDIYEYILFLDNNNFDALHLIGEIESQNCNYQQALFYYDKAINLNDKNAEIYLNKGNVFLKLGNLDKAIENYNLAIVINPNMYSGFFNIGNALKEAGNYTEAIKYYVKAIELNINYENAYVNLSKTMQIISKYLESNEILIKLLDINSNNFHGYFNIAVNYQFLNRHLDAIKYYSSAIDINPSFAEAYANRANSYISLKNYNAAISDYKVAVSIDAEIDFLYSNYLYAKSLICDWENYENEIKKLNSQLSNESKNTTINPLSIMSMLDDPQTHLKASENYTDSVNTEKRNISEYKINTNTGNKIRIGYFSSDYKKHPVSDLLYGILKKHNKSKFEVFGISLINYPLDDFKEKIIKQFDSFVEIEGKSEDEIVKIARDLNLDIAIDLNGFTHNNRSRIFKSRVAKIQVNYLGYPGTIANNSIDFIISDDVIIPNNYEIYYSEKVCRLENIYFPYDGNSHKTKRHNKNYFGINDRKFVYAAFNASYKITPIMFNNWMQILTKAENSVLWLSEMNVEAKKNILNYAMKFNIETDRIIFADRLENYNDHLDRISIADLALDTFPYGGHTTTGDFLMSGVPVLTLQGNSFASRVASSFVFALEIPELIATTDNQYVDKALYFYNNRCHLEQLKNELISKFGKIMDIKKYTLELEKAFSSMVKNNNS